MAPKDPPLIAKAFDVGILESATKKATMYYSFCRAQALHTFIKYPELAQGTTKSPIYTRLGERSTVLTT